MMSFLCMFIAPVFVHGFERYRPSMVFINMCVKMIIGKSGNKLNTVPNEAIFDVFSRRNVFFGPTHPSRAVSPLSKVPV